MKVVHGSESDAIFHLNASFDIDIVSDITSPVLINISRFLILSLMRDPTPFGLSSLGTIFVFLAPALFQECIAVFDVPRTQIALLFLVVLVACVVPSPALPMVLFYLLHRWGA